ncbi:MAG: hypothetical protein AB1511_05395 [Deinococcota bacterium]
MIVLGDGDRVRPTAYATYRDACARLENRMFGGTWGYAVDPPAQILLPPGETFQWGLQADEYGVMAVLIHACDPAYRDDLDARSGLTRPKGEVARRLGLNLREDEA